MTLILRGRKFGFSLEEIRQWLLIYDQEGTEVQLNAFVQMADSKMRDLVEQRVQLDETIKDLESLRATARKAIPTDK